MKRAALLGVVLTLTSAFLISCGSSSPSSRAGGTGLKFRAFVSQNVFSSTVLSGLDIINASTDQLARAPGISDPNQPGLMVVANNKVYTLVFDAGNNTINVINNKQESSAASIGLPGATESIAISPDASVGYAAIPTAPQPGQSPGAVEMLNLSNFTLAQPIPVGGVRYLVLSPDATHLLAFSQSANPPGCLTAPRCDTATLITLVNNGTATSPQWLFSGTSTITGLDRPVWAVFSSDGKTAYIMNCGAECGGTAAGVSPLDVSSIAVNQSVPAGPPFSVTAATYGALFGSTLYVAGSAPSNAGSCSNTSNSCGTLSVIAIANGTLQLINQVSITDGYHNRMAVTADNQVFIGARGCTNLTVPPGGNNPGASFGCLSLFNLARNPSSALIGPDLGDVTGIAPVTGRSEVYVIQNGELRLWDTTTDALRLPQFQLDLVGNAVDVKIVD